MNEKVLTQELVEMSAVTEDIDDDGIGGSFREFNINDLVRYIQVQHDIALVEELDLLRKDIAGYLDYGTLQSNLILNMIDNKITQRLHEKPVKREYNGYLKGNEKLREAKVSLITKDGKEYYLTTELEGPTVESVAYGVQMLTRELLKEQVLLGNLKGDSVQ